MLQNQCHNRFLIHNVSNSEVRHVYRCPRHRTVTTRLWWSCNSACHWLSDVINVALNSSSILRICGGLQRLMAWRTDEGKTPENVFFCNECCARRCHTCNCLQEDHDFVFDCHEAFHVILTSMWLKRTRVPCAIPDLEVLNAEDTFDWSLHKTYNYCLTQF